ncbi:MAG: hypothetical protein IKF29_04700 [Oceanobacillus sp.]|nr:hypothetical protein [Oceanobacillus sp.]
MVREHISFIPAEKKEQKQIESMIKTGEINHSNYKTLTPGQQEEVNEILFNIAESQITLSQGVSAVEFVLYAHIRLMRKKVEGIALSAQDKKIEEGLQKVLDLHEITTENIAIDDWLFDYMSYAENAAKKILKNREEHVLRKRDVTGQVQ